MIRDAEDWRVWERIAARPADLEDVRGIVAENSGLDQDFIRQTLTLFDRELGTAAVAEFAHLFTSPAP